MVERVQKLATDPMPRILARRDFYDKSSDVAKVPEEGQILVLVPEPEDCEQPR